MNPLTKIKAYLSIIILCFISDAYAESIQPNNHIPIQIKKNTHYPHQSKIMRSEVFSSYPLNVTGITLEVPLCIIGDDSLSRNWLERHHKLLEEAQAFCLITQVESEAHYQKLQNQYPKIKMAVAEVDWMVHILGVTHYPALISSEWVQQ